MSQFSTCFLLLVAGLASSLGDSHPQNIIPGYGLPLTDGVGTELFIEGLPEESLRSLMIPSYLEPILDLLEDRLAGRQIDIELEWFANVKSDECKGHMIEWVTRLLQLDTMKEDDTWALHCK